MYSKNTRTTQWTALILLACGAWCAARGDECTDKGRGEFTAGNFKQAVMTLERCVQAPAAWALLGRSYFELSYMQEAGRYLQKAADAFADSLELRILYARALGLNKEFKRSLEAFRNLRAAHPQNESIRRGLAQILGWNRLYAEAIVEYRALLKMQPADYEAWIEIGVLTSWDRKFKEALVEFDAIIKVGPPLEWEMKARLHRAEVLSWQKRFDESVVEFEHVIRIEPKAIDAYLGAGQVREWQAKYKDAITLYERALNVDPQNKIAKVRLQQLMWVK